MGLREKAFQIKKEFSSDRINNLESYYEGKVLKQSDLQDLKADFNRQIQSITSQLDRKLLDMQTLFEIGKEINSTLNLSDLINILLFTLIGQFRLYDIAIFILKDNLFYLLDKKGALELQSFQAAAEFINWTLGLDTAISLQDSHPFPELLKLFKASKLNVLVPMKNKENMAGLLLLGNKAGTESYSKDDFNFIYTLASLAGVAIENAHLYEILDKKYNELSTLYDVSRVINSSDDYSAVLSLIVETITTGFGVKKGLLFIEEYGNFIVRKTIGLSDGNIGKKIITDSPVNKLLKDNKTDVVPFNDGSLDKNPLNVPALLIPLVSLGKCIGGIFVFEFEHYIIGQENKDLINLFSIIASQVAPQALLTRMIQEQKEMLENPYQSIIRLIESEIEKAKAFELNVAFLMLKLVNFNKYNELHGSNEAFLRMDQLLESTKQIIPSPGLSVRYSSNQILYILPAILKNDLDDLTNSLYDKVKEVFIDNQQISIEANISTSTYPDTSEDKFALLNLIE